MSELVLRAAASEVALSVSELTAPPAVAQAGENFLTNLLTKVLYCLKS